MCMCIVVNTYMYNARTYIGLREIKKQGKHLRLGAALDENSNT